MNNNEFNVPQPFINIVKTEDVMLTDTEEDYMQPQGLAGILSSISSPGIVNGLLLLVVLSC